MPYVTVQQMLTHLIDSVQATPQATLMRDSRRAINSAYREIANRYAWSYYLKFSRLRTNAPQTTGTIQYTHSTRTVVLTGATWPSWAARAHIVYGGVAHKVERVIDSTTLLLGESDSLGSDINPGASYTLICDTYQLPEDVACVDNLVPVPNGPPVSYVRPQEFHNAKKNIDNSGRPMFFTVVGDPVDLGRMALRLIPIPSSESMYEMTYLRRPRRLALDDYHYQTIAMTSGNLSIAGDVTRWTADMVGAVLRAVSPSTGSADWSADNDPSVFLRMLRESQMIYEGRITAVNSLTSLTVDTSPAHTLSGVKYTISDPIDIEPWSMRNVFERCCEKHFAIVRKAENVAEATQIFESELAAAIEADERSLAHVMQENVDARYRRRQQLPAMSQTE